VSPKHTVSKQAGNRRAVTFLVAGLGLLLVVFLATKVLGGGGGKGSATPTINPTPAAGAVHSTHSTTTAVTAPPGPAPNTSRDPFKH
jgi:hypothetical protein